MNENTEIDINKIIVDLAQKMITDAATGIISKGKKIIKGLNDDLRLKLESSYKDYLACVYERYSKAKSFLIRDEAKQVSKSFIRFCFAF